MTDVGDETAVLIVAHGERGGRADNRLLLSLRDAVAGRTGLRSLHAGVLNGAPSIEEALQALAAERPRRLLVYPFFMSDGYFTRTVVPQRIAAAGNGMPWQLLAPLGLDPALAALIEHRALAEATAAGWPPQRSRLLLVGHGSSKSDASARATRAAAAAVGKASKFAAVATAFLEEPPFLADALADDSDPTIVVGFLSGEGLHGRDDIPAAISQARSALRYAGPIGAAAGVDALIAAAISAALRPSA